MGIAENLSEVRARIARAELSAGRAPGSVRLLAVSKFHSAAAVRAAYAAGQRDFGENYVQELCEKAAELSELAGVAWHMIGHLQRNKARKLAPLVESVDSVDSLELVEELGKRAELARGEREARLGPEGGRLKLLLEVSIAGEAQKSGAPLDSVPRLVEAVESQPALWLRGLMCVPPLSERAEDALPHFERLAALRAELGGAARLPELSMGMTQDLELAVRAGATQVRIGTAIFGERPPRAPSAW